MSQYPYPPQASIAPQPPARQPRRYSYLSAILRSAFSQDLWRDVGQNWRGIGLLYMLLLLAITWLLVTIQMARGFDNFLVNDAPKLVNQVPAVTITDGVVSIDVPQPYVVREPGTQQPIIIIDTTGEITAPPSPAGALLTENALIVRQRGNDLRTYEFSDVKSFHLDQARINGWIATLRTWFFPVMFSLCLLFGFTWRLLLMLVGGAIGLLFASGFRAPISYAAAMRLSAIAMTPGILLSTLLSLLSVPGLGCFSFLLHIGIFVTILAFAVRANAPETPTDAPGFPVLPPPGATPPPPMPQ